MTQKSTFLKFGCNFKRDLTTKVVYEVLQEKKPEILAEQHQLKVEY